MLQQLSISNYALIKELSISPDKGLNIITGETGAGKSIMLGALGLLLGKRADTKVLFDSSRKCVIEGTFDISDYHLKGLFEEFDVDYDAECIVRREISSSGKSRAFVNDGVVNLDFLKQLGASLMDIHSQHDTLLLGTNAFQLNLIDAFAQNTELKESYSRQHLAYQEKKEIHEQLVQESAELRKEADYNQFLFDELEKGAFQAGEQETLEADLTKLENAEDIKTRLNEALAIADQADFNINSFLVDLKNAINQISSFSSNYESLNSRVESVLIELKDITGELEQEEANVEYDPARTEEVQERLSLLYKLQQKHQVADIDALLQIQEALSDKVLRVENLDDAIEAADAARAKALEKLNKLGDRLSASRQKIFKPFQAQITELLAGLGMPNARLAIDHKSQEPGANGKDHITLLFSANKGVDPQPLKTAASGGEFSRLMFAVKYILADKTALPTIVFDEIDAGISGEVAIQMAQMMTVMAENHQVMTITHLPQIAARGTSHYFVYKDDAGESTASGIRKLNDSERLLEIAQMIGGKSPSEKTMESAKELLSL
ncbi:MAG: DNA repair protein RecN [Roseivirga sp.]